MVQLTAPSEMERVLLEGLAKTLPHGWRLTVRRSEAGRSSRPDLHVEIVSPTGDRIEAHVELTSRAEPAELVRLTPWLRQHGSAIVVAPQIGPRARDVLNQAGVGWFEPEGDCRIALGSLYVERLTRRPRRRPAGSPGTRYVAELFSGGSLRVVRWLLIEPDRSWTLADLAARTGLSLGFVSRVLKTLARDAYIDRIRAGSRVRDRDALLDAWASATPPREHRQERVALVGRVDDLLRTIREARVSSPYALTAEAAADQIAPFARYSRVEVYVADVSEWDRALGLTAVPRGGNLVLIEPADLGVFDGSFDRSGLRLVSRPQLFVDLVRRGGVASEAATFIRERGELWPT